MNQKETGRRRGAIKLQLSDAGSGDDAVGLVGGRFVVKRGTRKAMDATNQARGGSQSVIHNGTS